MVHVRHARPPTSARLAALKLGASDYPLTTNFKAATQGRQIRHRPGVTVTPTPRRGWAFRLNKLAGGLAEGLAGPCHNRKSLPGIDSGNVMTPIVPNSCAPPGLGEHSF